MKLPLSLLTDEDNEKLESLFTKYNFGSEDVIIKQHDEHGSIFYLEEGSVRIEQDVNGRGVPISSLPQGSLFGEVAFLTEAGASASVIADSYSVVYIMDQKALAQLLEQHPDTAIRFYRSLARLLADRLVISTRAVITPTTWR